VYGCRRPRETNVAESSYNRRVVGRLDHDGSYEEQNDCRWSGRNPMTEPAADISRVGVILDDACGQPTRYRRYQRARELIVGAKEIPGLGDLEDELDIDDLEDPVAGAPTPPDALTAAEAAAWAAMRFEPKVELIGSHERVVMNPHMRTNDTTDPATVDQTTTEMVDTWTALADAVATAPARARLRHLLFERGGTERRAHGETAIDAYIETSTTDVRAPDRVDAARYAVRLARAINDGARLGAALQALTTVAREAIDGPHPNVRAADDALATLTHEKEASVHDLIELACQHWDATGPGLRFWRMKLTATTHASDRDKVWEQLVDLHVNAAEASSSEIVRASRLRDALELAEECGIKTVRNRVAVLVQGIRHRDLEMMRFQASNHMFEEVIESVIADVLNDNTVADNETPPDNGTDEMPAWFRRLLAWGNHPSPTGEPHDSRTIVEAQHRNAPLQFLFPIALQTPEGLPLYSPKDADERFELDMVKWETQLLNQWSPILAEALNRVARPDVPPIETLAKTFANSAAADDHTAAQLAEAFIRFWTGDTLGSLYTSVPMIESLVRHSVLATDRGIYRLQKNQSPSQYVGLGALLDHLSDGYTVSERDQRFFRALLTHPGGWNLRNELAHGYLASARGSIAAVALYAALKVILIVSDGPSQDDNQSEDEGEPGADS
jgi:hypothetical protein